MSKNKLSGYMAQSIYENLVIILDTYSGTTDAIIGAIRKRCPETDVISVSDRSAVESLQTDRRIDCLVAVDDGTNESSAAFFDRVDSPVVLYTATDPTAIDQSVLDATEMLVQWRPDEENLEFLAEKIHAVLAPAPDSDRTQYAVASAQSRIEEQPCSETHFFIVDDDGTTVWASSPFADVFPVRRLEADLQETASFDERLARLFAGDPAALRTVTRTKHGESPAGRESVTIPTPDDDLHFVHSGYEMPAVGESLRLEVFEHVTTDVYRRGRVELLERLVDGSKDGLYTLDARGNIDFCNQAFAEMTGYDRSDLLGEHASKVLVEGELERGQERIEQLLNDPKRDSITIDMTFVRRSGETFDVSIHFTLLTATNGSYAGLIGSARDITERKEREQTLKQYRRLVEAARDPMYVLDRTGVVVLCNDAMADIAVGSQSELVGTHITQLVPSHNIDAVRETFESLRTGANEWEQFELWIQKQDGSERLYEATTGVLTADDSFSGCVGILRDITERNRRADELNLLQQVLGRVLRHDIRSKLTIIRCHASRLEAGKGDVETAAKEMLATMDELLSTVAKARKISQLVESDLDRTSLQLDQVVDAAVGAVASNYPDADYDISVPAVTVQAHPSFRYAVENAVENAVIHSGTNPCVRVGATVGNAHVTVAIEDNGPGIPANELEALERHQETQISHATGVGLWLIDWVVTRSAGTLAFESDKSGTTVRIELDRGNVGTV